MNGALIAVKEVIMRLNCVLPTKSREASFLAQGQEALERIHSIHRIPSAFLHQTNKSIPEFRVCDQLINWYIEL